VLIQFQSLPLWKRGKYWFVALVSKTSPGQTGAGPIPVVSAWLLSKYDMRFGKWLLNEGRFEQQTTMISRSIVNALKTVSNVKNGIVFFHGDPSVIHYPFPKIPLQGLEHFVLLNIVVVLMDTKGDPYIGGGFEPIENVLEVEMQIPLTRMNELFNKVITKLKEVIRHELEHSGQNSEFLKPGLMNLSQQMSVYDNDKNLLNYVLEPAELEAFVSGLYKQAKTMRIPFSQILEKFIAQQLIPRGVTPQDAQRVRVAYTNYQKKRFPRAT
jgi:hypothetical protein